MTTPTAPRQIVAHRFAGQTPVLADAEVHVPALEADREIAVEHRQLGTMWRAQLVHRSLDDRAEPDLPPVVLEDVGEQGEHGLFGDGDREDLEIGVTGLVGAVRGRQHPLRFELGRSGRAHIEREPLECDQPALEVRAVRVVGDHRDQVLAEVVPRRTRRLDRFDCERDGAALPGLGERLVDEGLRLGPARPLIAHPTIMARRIAQGER